MQFRSLSIPAYVDRVLGVPVFSHAFYGFLTWAKKGVINLYFR